MENEEGEANNEQYLDLYDPLVEFIVHEAMQAEQLQPQQQIIQGDLPQEDNNASVVIIDDAVSENNPNVNLDTQEMPDNLNLSDSQVTPSRKKRKRSLSAKKTTPKKPAFEDDDDDGTMCSICFDSWELSGNHRIVSLKCGHLFGESCIRRWIRECAQNAKCCPTCKARSQPRDIRPIFARKISAVDKSEEYRLRELVEAEKTKNTELQDNISKLRIQLAIFRDKYTTLEAQYENAKLNGFVFDVKVEPSVSLAAPKMYKIALEKNIELNREPGCRAMAYGRRTQTLVLSQKSATTLFPGFGVRFLNAYNLQVTNSLLHISTKQLRDISLDKDEELLLTASIDKGAKLFSIPNKCPISQFTPSESLLWAVSFDSIRTKSIYIGAQNGNTYLYDIRNPQTYIEEFSTVGDASPVISITSLPQSDPTLPFGGFLVCKLQSLWFYEYTASQQIIPTKLLVDGPFVSMTYDDNTKFILISTRPTAKYGAARHLVGNLTKIEQTVVFNVVSTIIGSKVEKVMIRSTQMKVDDENLVAAYLQDTNTLATWNVRNAIRMQSFVVKDIIYDTCPMYVNNKVMLATLSDTKCRIYNVNSS